MLEALRQKIEDLEKIAREPIPRQRTNADWLREMGKRSDAAAEVRRIREADFQGQIQKSVARSDAYEKARFAEVGINPRWVDWLNRDAELNFPDFPDF